MRAARRRCSGPRPRRDAPSLVSGLTVMTAAGGLMLSGNSVFTSLGIGTILVVLVAVLGSLTVLPAVLAKLGDRVEWGRLRFLQLEPRVADLASSAAACPALSEDHRGRRSRAAARHRVTGAAHAHAGRRRLGRSAEPSGREGLQAGDEGIRHDERARRRGRARAAISTRRASGPSIAAFRKDVHRPVKTIRHADNTVELDVPLAGDGADAASMRALHTLRSRVIPSTIGSVPGRAGRGDGRDGRQRRLHVHHRPPHAAGPRLRVPADADADAALLPLAHRRR